ncbi:MAG: hypothetical protein II998_10010 [Clostridia bacterium]|nr:hypothetical protein [Clostridia bacterium]
MKKVLCLFLSVVMLMGISPLVMAESESSPVTEMAPLHDAWIGRSSSASVYTSACTDGTEAIVRLFHNVNYDAEPAWSNATIGAFAYDVTDVFETLSSGDGYVIDKVFFKPYQSSKYGSVADMKLHFYHITTKWSETAEEGYVEFTSANKNLIFPLDASYTAGPKFANSPSLTIDEPNGEITSEYDITSLFKLHQATCEGTELQNFFSFALTMTNSNTGSNERDIATKESGNGAELVVTYKKPEALTVAEAVFPENPSENISVTFNNPIDTAVVSLNGEELSDKYITIENEIVTVEYDLFKNTTYSFEIVATDIYGDTENHSAIFTTTHSTEEHTQSPISAIHIGAGESDISSYFEAIGGSNHGNGIVLYGFDAPKPPENGYIEKAEFSFWVRGNDIGVYAYKFDGDPENEELSLSSDSVQNALTQENSLIASAIETGNSAQVSSYTWYEYTADVTAYINELVFAGDAIETAYVAVGSNSTTRLAGQSYSGNLPIKLNIITNLDPAIEAQNKAFSIRGAKLESLSFTLMTVFDKNVLLENLCLRSEDGDVVDVKFDYNTSNSKVYLAEEEALMLRPDTVYEVVILGGASDVFENVAEDDIVITAFKTKANFEVAIPKIVASDASLDAESFEDASNLESLGGSAKAVCVLTNNDYVGERKAYLAIATYDTDGCLSAIKLAPITVGAGETVFAETESVSTPDEKTAKAFIWNDIEIGGIDPLASFAQVDR